MTNQCHYASCYFCFPWTHYSIIFITNNYCFLFEGLGPNSNWIDGAWYRLQRCQSSCQLWFSNFSCQLHSQDRYVASLHSFCHAILITSVKLLVALLSVRSYLCPECWVFLAETVQVLFQKQVCLYFVNFVVYHFVPEKLVCVLHVHLCPNILLICNSLFWLTGKIGLVCFYLLEKGEIRNCLRCDCSVF